MIELSSSVQYLKGVGPRRAATLESAGIRTVEDLLNYRPFRYEDRTRFRRIAQLCPDEEAVIQAEVLVTGYYRTPMKRVQIFEMLVSDGSASLLVKFFNQVYLDKVFRKGQRVILFGAPKTDTRTGALGLLNPEFEIVDPTADLAIHVGRITPIYRRIGQLTTKALRQMLFSLLEALPEEIEDPLPAAVRAAHDFPDRRSSLRSLHFPECPPGTSLDRFMADLEAGRARFQRRLVFEEFFFFHLGLQALRRRRQLAPRTRVIQVTETVREAVKRILPFHPTAAQKRVLKEIVSDLAGPTIMNRLLQGDVGSGKTIVALQAIVVVIENGGQTALMAPTEILAEQHFNTVQTYLAGARYRTGLLTSAVKGKRRKDLLEAARDGEIDLLIGTHALVEDKVQFKNLALVVIDEQHRFGVLQRSDLMDKGDCPDTLVMTATPIPRSLALTLYGDLDISILDEAPPGRSPVRTLVRTDRDRVEVYNLIRAELDIGRQAYLVYPLIEQSDKVDLRAATDMFRHLQGEVFPEFRLELLHGRLKAEEKDQLMTRFKSGQIQALVSTTVIEVGIDVPNATVMMVEHADRFGLSQLHQLRGRIGRGSHPGLCVLMTEGGRSREAFERLEIMRRTNDGFRIAEKDLELRGPGEFLGTRQSGMPQFRFGNIVRDRGLLEEARADAEAWLAGGPGAGDAAALERLISWWKQRYGLSQVG
jgi:ATP-dependent DNA helicase RecG